MMFKLLLVHFIIAEVSSLTSYIEVESGKSVILPCESNVENHFFSFWELASKEIISPGNNYNRTKYDYEVISGRLFIFNTKVTQEGIYTCVSRGTEDNTNVKVSSVYLFVKKTWKDVYEGNKLLNIARVFIIIGSATALAMGIYLVYTKWKRKKRIQLLLDDIENGSDTEEMQPFDLPSTSNGISLFSSRAQDNTKSNGERE